MPSTFPLLVLVCRDTSFAKCFAFTHFLDAEQETYTFVTNR